MEDPILFDCFEADLLEYYNFDIYDYFRGQVFCRRLLLMLTQLPADSRLSRRIRNDPLRSEEHLLLTIIDSLSFSGTQAKILAAATIGSKEYSKIAKGFPKPIERPKYVITEEDKPKKKFFGGKELQAMLGLRVKSSGAIHHTTACITAGTSSTSNGVQCACPVEENRKS